MDIYWEGSNNLFRLLKLDKVRKGFLTNTIRNESNNGKVTSYPTVYFFIGRLKDVPFS